MGKKIINTKNAPAPVGPYSQAVETGSLVFCAGQIALDPQTGELRMGSIKEQTEQVLKNIEGVLQACGLGFESVVKTTIFLTDMNDFATVNEIYGTRFRDNPPARSTIAVKSLPKGVNVEIEVIASR